MLWHKNALFTRFLCHKWEKDAKKTSFFCCLWEIHHIYTMISEKVYTFSFAIGGIGGIEFTNHLISINLLDIGAITKILIELTIGSIAIFNLLKKKKHKEPKK